MKKTQKSPFDLPLMTEERARFQVAKIMADVTCRVPKHRKLLRTLMMERARRVAGPDRERFLDDRPGFWAEFLLPGGASLGLVFALLIGAFVVSGSPMGWFCAYAIVAYLPLLIFLQSYTLSGPRAYWNARDTALLKDILGREILSVENIDFSEYGIDSNKASDIINESNHSARVLGRITRSKTDLFNFFACSAGELFHLWREVGEALDEPLWRLKADLKDTVPSQGEAVQ